MTVGAAEAGRTLVRGYASRAIGRLLIQEPQQQVRHPRRLFLLHPVSRTIDEVTAQEA